MIQNVSNWGDAILVSVTGALVAFLSFIPALIGALVLLVIGWWIAAIVARLVERLLNRVGFEHAAERTGITGFIGGTGAGQMRATHVIGQLVKWFIRLIFLEMAAQALHLTAVTTLLNSIVLFIPNLIVALIIVLVGVLLAQFVGRLLRGSLVKAGMANANVLAAVAEYGIIGLALVTAPSQIGIAAIIVTILFSGVVGSLALAAGLAFGLGGRETAAEIWQPSYETTPQAVMQLLPAAPGDTEPAELFWVIKNGVDMTGMPSFGLAGAPEAPEQLGPGDMQLRPALHLRVMGQRVQDEQPGVRALGHGHRDRPVGLHHRGRLVADQFPVEQRDLPPVGCLGAARGAMAGRDGRVQLIGPRAAQP